MITGKNKEQFERYLVSNEIATVVFDDGDYTVLLYDLPLSMQFGVIQDYADSIGYAIEVLITTDGLYNYYINMVLIEDRLFKTRDEARLAAIKAFGEIVNRDTRIVKHLK